MLLEHHGVPSSFRALQQRVPPTSAGMTLLYVKRLLEEHGLQSRALRCSMKDLWRVKMPCVIHWQMERFAVLFRMDPPNFHVRDPAQYRCVFDSYAFECHFCETVLEVLDVPEDTCGVPEGRVR